MKAAKQLSFRLPEATVGRVEHCAQEMRQSRSTATRADVVACRLRHALDDRKCKTNRLLRSPSVEDRLVADVAAGLGVAENLLHAWKKKLGSATEQVRRERGGETAEEELKRLRREVTQLKQ